MTASNTLSSKATHNAVVVMLQLLDDLESSGDEV